jgi:hypothetical protein
MRPLNAGTTDILNVLKELAETGVIYLRIYTVNSLLVGHQVSSRDTVFDSNVLFKVLLDIRGGKIAPHCMFCDMAGPAGVLPMGMAILRPYIDFMVDEDPEKLFLLTVICGRCYPPRETLIARTREYYTQWGLSTRRVNLHETPGHA